MKLFRKEKPLLYPLPSTVEESREMQLRMRARELIKMMGEKYLCHRANQVVRASIIDQTNIKRLFYRGRESIVFNRDHWE